MRTTWTDELVEQSLRKVIEDTGFMPSNTYLNAVGRGDLANQLSRRGGFLSWAKRVGADRPHSDSDTGWQGEEELCEILQKNGFNAIRPDGVKSPFDILVNGILRVDVKSARHTSYGPGGGWYYRIGKIPQADIIALYQLDTQDCYFVPWQICPRTNVTISRGGGKFKRFLNAYGFLSKLILMKRDEPSIWPAE